jgi:hypothetical protein
LTKSRSKCARERNSSAATILDECREQRWDHVVTLSLDWGTEGEVRVGGGAASLWGYVITSDDLGRDVFRWVDASDLALASVLISLVESIRRDAAHGSARRAALELSAPVPRTARPPCVTSFPSDAGLAPLMLIP